MSTPPILSMLLDSLDDEALDLLADRLAPRIKMRLSDQADRDLSDAWLDSKRAAAYLACLRTRSTSSPLRARSRLSRTARAASAGFDAPSWITGDAVVELIVVNASIWSTRPCQQVLIAVEAVKYRFQVASMYSERVKFAAISNPRLAASVWG